MLSCIQTFYINRAADLVPISFEGGETPMDVSPVKEQLVFGSRNEIRLRRSMNTGRLAYRKRVGLSLNVLVCGWERMHICVSCI